MCVGNQKARNAIRVGEYPYIPTVAALLFVDAHLSSKNNMLSFPVL